MESIKLTSLPNMAHRHDGRGRPGLCGDMTMLRRWEPDHDQVVCPVRGTWKERNVFASRKVSHATIAETETRRWLESELPSFLGKKVMESDHASGFDTMITNPFPCPTIKVTSTLADTL